MQPTRITRPHFPPGYMDQPTAEIAWEAVAGKLARARHYWLCTVRADGRPHCVPRWGVFLDGRLYYDGSPETRHARNLLSNPHVSLHLESGEQAVILEGRRKPPETGPGAGRTPGGSLPGQVRRAGLQPRARPVGRGRPVRLHPAPVHRLDGVQ